jgi:hypothetical protein
VGGIAARAAVAHGIQPPIAAVDLGDRLGRIHHGLTVPGEEGAENVLMMSRLLSHRLDQRGVQCLRVLLLAVQERVKLLQMLIWHRCHS